MKTQGQAKHTERESRVHDQAATLPLLRELNEAARFPFLRLELVDRLGGDLRLHGPNLVQERTPVREGPHLARCKRSRQFADAQSLGGLGQHPGDAPPQLPHFIGDGESSGDVPRSDVGDTRSIARAQENGVSRKKIVRDIFARKIRQHFRGDFHRLERRPFIQKNPLLA